MKKRKKKLKHRNLLAKAMLARRCGLGPYTDKKKQKNKKRCRKSITPNHE